MHKNILDSGAKLMVVDDMNPEDVAMLQALYSRSAESAETHLDKVKATGSGKFMSQFYVNYGHKSIADTGSTTMFIEDVSLLAAKAVQDWPLYSGQETSTRYIDMSKRHIIDPVGTSESRSILDAWMNFYRTNQERVQSILVRRYPKRPDEKDETYTRAIKARTFDVLRGFLPAGITTQLSWHTNLRQAGDHLVGLAQHPSAEIADVARGLQTLLAAQYPSSGFDRHIATVSGVGAKEGDASRTEWEAKYARDFAYPVTGRLHDTRMVMQQHAGFIAGTRWIEALKTRPRGCVLPHFMTDFGQFTFTFLLDFGSFRDIQRHRNGVCRMPLLDTSYGFEPWYLEQLGDPDNDNVGGLRDEAVKLIHELSPRIMKLTSDEVVRQYYTALGYRVACQVAYALPALVYVMELRSGKTIHPTLRRQIHVMVRLFQQHYPEIALHVDLDPDDWDVRRGDQTITKKS